jgi:CubicO group peptidase (beta-lactamase class C family)
MRLVAERRIDLAAPAGDFVELPLETARVTVAQLAGHSSGLPAHARFYERLLAGERLGAPSAREALVRMAAATPLARPAGRVSVYSDIGYILLGTLLERATGRRLDELTATLVTDPLGMDNTRFVDLDAVPRFRFAPGAVAPTEVCPHRGLIVGEVHDENAHAAGGICGHAGLFSTAGDLSLFAAAICRAIGGDASTPFSPAVAQRFTTTPGAPGSTWRLGWDTPSPLPALSHAGDLWPGSGIGHLGFTGCSLWLDPPRRRWVVLLTNRVHLSRDKEAIRDLRREVMDAVFRELFDTE